MRPIRTVPTKGKSRIALIVDGKCETWYFQMFKKNERNTGIDLKPEIPQKKNLREQYERVLEHAKDYDKVYWIVDYDVITKETRETRKGIEPAEQEFKRYYIKLLKEAANVTVIVNNPCLEFWLLLHYEETSKYFSDCDSTTKRLKKYLPDYDKSEKYYTKQGNDIYLKLKSLMPAAIINAQKLPEFDINNPNRGMTQMQLIISALHVGNGLHKIKKQVQ